MKQYSTLQHPQLLKELKTYLIPAVPVNKRENLPFIFHLQHLKSCYNNKRKVEVYNMNKLDEIKKMFAEKIKIENPDPNTDLKALGLDSLDLVELIMDIEEKFGVEFTNEELMDLKTISDVYAAIEKKLN